MATKYSAFTTLHSLFCTPLRRGCRGQAIVEYAIVFPVQLMLTLAIIQLAHLFVAKQVLEYGAFCAARAAMIADPGATEEEVKELATAAAVIPISAIAGPSGVSEPDSVELPGWGTLKGSGAAREKTDVTVLGEIRSGVPVIKCNVEHDYELDVPVGNLVVYSLGDIFLRVEDLYYWGDAPHVRMKSCCALPKP